MVPFVPKVIVHVAVRNLKGAHCERFTEYKRVSQSQHSPMLGTSFRNSLLKTHLVCRIGPTIFAETQYTRDAVISLQLLAINPEVLAVYRNPKKRHIRPIEDDPGKTGEPKLWPMSWKFG